MKEKQLTKNQLRRFPVYYNLFHKYVEAGIKYVNAQMIADSLDLNKEQVRKDIASFSTVEGIPNKGRELSVMIYDLEKILGLNNENRAVVIGIGSLGRAFLNYNGFKEYGLNLIGGFDINPAKSDQIINGIRIYDSHRMYLTIKEIKAQIGIITVPANQAQEVADELVEAGIEGIWNFAPANIKVPPHVILTNVNMASSLAELSHKLYMKKVKGEK